MNKKIDFTELMEGYNRKFNTQYKDVRSWLEEIYVKHKTLEKLADVLGISRNCVRATFRKLNLSVQRKGGGLQKYTYKHKMNSIPFAEIQNMKPGQLARLLGCTPDWASDLKQKRISEEQMKLNLI